MDSRIDHQTARAMLAWHIECGADEAILDAPIDRYGLDAVLAKPAAPATVAASDSAPEAAPTPVDPAQIAAAMAANAADLPTLRDTMDRFPYCELRQGARNFVFADCPISQEIPETRKRKSPKPFSSPPTSNLEPRIAHSHKTPNPKRRIPSLESPTP
jgi:hypothetical protein